MKEIQYTELPAAALERISPEQLSYIDEFDFFLVESDGQAQYRCYYGGAFLAVWRGNGWEDAPDQELDRWFA